VIHANTVCFHYFSELPDRNGLSREVATTSCVKSRSTVFPQNMIWISLFDWVISLERGESFPEEHRANDFLQ
jgi:hypothetical protein